MTICAVQGCSSNSNVKQSGISYHGLPDWKNRSETTEKWLRILRDNGKGQDWATDIKLKNVRMCSKHFKENDLHRLYNEKGENYYTKLKPGAVPTIFPNQQQQQQQQHHCQKVAVLPEVIQAIKHQQESVDQFLAAANYGDIQHRKQVLSNCTGTSHGASQTTPLVQGHNGVDACQLPDNCGNGVNVVSDQSASSNPPQDNVPAAPSRSMFDEGASTSAPVEYYLSDTATTFREPFTLISQQGIVDNMLKPLLMLLDCTSNVFRLLLPQEEVKNFILVAQQLSEAGNKIVKSSEKSGKGLKRTHTNKPDIATGKRHRKGPHTEELPPVTEQFTSFSGLQHSQEEKESVTVASMTQESGGSARIASNPANTYAHLQQQVSSEIITATVIGDPQATSETKKQATVLLPEQYGIITVVLQEQNPVQQTAEQPHSTNYGNELQQNTQYVDEVLGFIPGGEIIPSKEVIAEQNAGTGSDVLHLEFSSSPSDQANAHLIANNLQDTQDSITVPPASFMVPVGEDACTNARIVNSTNIENLTTHSFSSSQAENVEATVPDYQHPVPVPGMSTVESQHYNVADIEVQAVAAGAELEQSEAHQPLTSLIDSCIDGDQTSELQLHQLLQCCVKF